MANLVTSDFFVVEIGIPNISKQEINESLNVFIGKYEQEVLFALFGYELLKSYNADSTTDRFLKIVNGTEYYDGTKKWNGLVYKINDINFSLIANYIYYYWLRDKHIWNSGIGTIRPAPNQAVNISPGLKMVSAWNSFSSDVCEFIDYMNNSTEIYPEWNSVNIWKFRRTNDFDI